jgi:DNA/RNA-binding domain of Phe-tRNA-synthetase-like protein
MFEITESWKSSFPSANVGILAIRNASNPPHHAGLDREKEALENQLRTRFAGQDRSALTALPVLQAYAAYYKRFKKTYHVELQLESIVFKGKAIPRVAALVEAMFMAELKNQLLTAGHDLDRLQLPARLEVSKGTESYTLLRGESQILKPMDMYIADRDGIMSNIIYGPDERTRIREDTKSALYTVYAPAGISAESVMAHLQDIEGYVHLFAPQAQTEVLQVLGSGK